MLSRIGDHLRSNVVGYVALFIALSGTAYALSANSVKSKHIKDNQVKSVDVRDDTLSDGGLHGADLATDSVGGDEVVDGSIHADDISDDQGLGPPEIATGDLFNDNSLNGADIDESSLSGFNPDQVGPRVYARVEAAGDVTEADTKGLTDTNVTTTGGGILYCFEVGFDVNTITGVAESGTAPVDRFVTGYNQGGAPCAASDDAMAFVWDVSGGAAISAEDFYVEMN